MQKTLIKNANIIDPDRECIYMADILCEDGIIARIAENIQDDQAIVKDVSGDYVAPGLVDVHSHFRDPGFTHKEDIITGAKAAKKGGYTSIVLMANTNPVVDSEETIKYVTDKGSQTDINIYTCATVTTNMLGKELVDMDRLKAAGAVGFTDDGKPIMDESLVMKAMKKTASLKVPISFHEENPEYITNNGINAGKAAKHYGIKGSPREAEITMIERDLELALETGAIIDIQHISTKEGVELVRKAKADSRNKGGIHAEATPHHFTLTEDAVITYGSNAKMNPPLRTEEDRKAVVEGLRDGTIEIIATDHAPHSTEEKSGDITKAPSGIIGLETALALSVNVLVKKEGLSLIKVIKALTSSPADMYGLNAGHIRVGSPADFCVFNPDKKVIIDSFESKSCNTPFHNMEGFYIRAYVGGKIDE